MNRPLLAPLLLALLALGPLETARASDLNKPAPSFKNAKDDAGKSHSLSSYKGKVVVLVVWSSRCRYCRDYGPALEALRKKLEKQKKKVVFLAVAPNRTETAARIKKGKRQGKITFPVIRDAGGKIAKAYKAKTTPTVFVIDAAGKLRYKGAIDDNPKRKKATTKHHLKDALDAVLAGKTPAKQKTGGAGFRIKY